MTDLISLVGGRAAEEVVFGSVTNGAMMISRRQLTLPRQ